jgi:hypothetical protein
VNNINLTRQFLDPAGHNMIVQRAGANRAKKPVGNAKLSPRKGWTNFHTCRNRLMKDTRKDQDLRTGSCEAVYLLPCCVANPVRAQLVREAVQDANWLASAAHLLGSFPAGAGQRWS